MNDANIVFDSIASEIRAFNRAGFTLAHRHEAVLGAAICNGYRRAFDAEGIASGLSAVESYYRYTRSDLVNIPPKGDPRIDVYCKWPNAERFVEIKWAWAKSGHRSWLDYYLWPAVRDLGKLAHYTRVEDSDHSWGRCVFVYVIASQDPADVIERELAKARSFTGLPDSETLRGQCENTFKGLRHALLPGDVDTSDWPSLWSTLGYLKSVLRGLAKSAHGRVDERILADGPEIPVSERRRYVVVVGRF